jgi:hypothetical protein
VAPELPQGVTLDGSFDTLTADVEQEAGQLAVIDTGALIDHEIGSLHNEEALQLSVGVLMERLYCPTQAHLFYSCFQQSGLTDAFAAAAEGGPCYAEHELFADCIKDRNVTIKCTKFVEFFARAKCIKESEALKQCINSNEGAGKSNRTNCSAVALTAFGCGAKHVLGLFSTVPEDK